VEVASTSEFQSSFPGAYNACSPRAARTLLEVIIGLVVIAVLVELALPFILRSRESARASACEEKLAQLAQAVTQHHAKIGHYPTGGWNRAWLGDPDRGYGRGQPGSWEFSVLPYLESTSTSLVRKGLTGKAKSDAIVSMCTTPLPVFVCTVRRQPAALPLHGVDLTTNDALKLPLHLVARSDFAINAGDFGTAKPTDKESSMVPKTLEEASDPAFQWYDTSKYNGISYGRSEVKSSELKQGISKVYMLAEKAIKADCYLTGTDKGDNASMYSGFDDDNTRTAAALPERDTVKAHDSAFGGAHPDFWLVALCDASIHRASFNIDRTVHKRLASRTSKGLPANFTLD
jgi:type II secretory pathway pseudopilin PulG